MESFRRSEKHLLDDGTVLCVSNKNISPFSWMKYAVLSEEDFLADNHAILRHEKAHIRLHHSRDMILFDLFTCLFWFNPISWLLRREIQSVHEYQADAHVLDKGVDPKQYQLLLIRKSIGEQKFALANNFHRRDLHQRIIMMMKSRTSQQKKWNYALTLPVLFLAMIALSVPKLNAKILGREQVKSAIDLYGEEGRDGVILIETKAKVKNKEMGSINLEAATPERTNPEDLLSGETKSTREKGAKIGAEVMDSIRNNGNKVIIRSKNEVLIESALYIVDNEKMDSEFDVSSIDPKDIESLSVLKDKSALDLYGEEGKNGVVIISLKKADNNPVE